MMAAFLYLGAGIGISMYRFVNKVIGKRQKEEPLTKKELPYTIGMVVLDIIAPNPFNVWYQQNKCGECLVT